MKKILFTALVATGLAFGIANAGFAHEIKNERKGCDKARVCLEKITCGKLEGPPGLLPHLVRTRELRHAHAPGKHGNAREKEIMEAVSNQRIPPCIHIPLQPLPVRAGRGFTFRNISFARRIFGLFQFNIVQGERETTSPLRGPLKKSL